MNKKKKILVCLSGGVDSSVAAALLVQQGYAVTGAFMINYDDAKREDQENCWRHEYQDAARVAAHLGIPLLRWDFTKEYKRDVLDYMYREYKAGRTPNPDILCNKYIKFEAWLNKAINLGFDTIATGHYATVKNKDTRIEAQELLKSRDGKKDQTYFLHQLNQEQLSHVMFPVGEYTKTQVRALAKKFKLPTATKDESMGICFVGEVPMKEFLEKKIKHKPGKVLLTSGEEIGSHDGLAFYTIGQRQALNLKADNRKLITNNKAVNQPLYVVKKDVKTNTLIVGLKDDAGLLQKEVALTEVHWISGQEPVFPLQCEVRLRHQQPLQKCQVLKKGKTISVLFATAQWGVTPGQFAVFYQGKNCLGGGVVV